MNSTIASNITGGVMNNQLVILKPSSLGHTQAHMSGNLSSATFDVYDKLKKKLKNLQCEVVIAEKKYYNLIKEIQELEENISNKETKSMEMADLLEKKATKQDFDVDDDLPATLSILPKSDENPDIIDSKSDDEMEQGELCLSEFKKETISASFQPSQGRVHNINTSVENIAKLSSETGLDDTKDSESEPREGCDEIRSVLKEFFLETIQCMRSFSTNLSLIKELPLDAGGADAELQCNILRLKDLIKEKEFYIEKMEEENTDLTIRIKELKEMLSDMKIKKELVDDQDKTGQPLEQSQGGGSSGSDEGDRDRNNYTSFSLGNSFGLSQPFFSSLGIRSQFSSRVFVTNLDYKVVTPQKLEEVFKLAGYVVSIEMQPNKEEILNFTGNATIEMGHPIEAVQAISMFNGQKLFNRRMIVTMKQKDKEDPEDKKLPEGLQSIGKRLWPYEFPFHL